MVVIHAGWTVNTKGLLGSSRLYLHSRECTLLSPHMLQTLEEGRGWLHIHFIYGTPRTWKTTITKSLLSEARTGHFPHPEWCVRWTNNRPTKRLHELAPPRPQQWKIFSRKTSGRWAPRRVNTIRSNGTSDSSKHPVLNRFVRLAQNFSLIGVLLYFSVNEALWGRCRLGILFWNLRDICHSFVIKHNVCCAAVFRASASLSLLTTWRCQYTPRIHTSHTRCGKRLKKRIRARTRCYRVASLVPRCRSFARISQLWQHHSQ